MLLLTSFYSSKRKRRMWLLQQDKVFRIDHHFITVPKGYWFDGASVPRLLWVFASPIGKAFEPACLHDWLYDTLGQSGQYSRKEVDSIFLQHMRLEGIGTFQRYSFWIAVRMFGWAHWNKESIPNVHQ